MTEELFLSTDMVGTEIRDGFWRDAVKLFYEVSSIKMTREEALPARCALIPLATC